MKHNAIAPKLHKRGLTAAAPSTYGVSIGGVGMGGEFCCLAESCCECCVVVGVLLFKKCLIELSSAKSLSPPNVEFWLFLCALVAY